MQHKQLHLCMLKGGEGGGGSSVFAVQGSHAEVCQVHAAKVECKPTKFQQLRIILLKLQQASQVRTACMTAPRPGTCHGPRKMHR